jgi:uncharacterized membrane protein YphA (DoxX/SURF4 family)
MFTIYTISRVSLAIVFLYHGLVPKLLFANEQEILMNSTLMPFVGESAALLYSGIAEVLYGILLLVFFRNRFLLYPALFFSVAVTIPLLITLPSLFQNAFNPFSINLSVLALAWINKLSLK